MNPPITFTIYGYTMNNGYGTIYSRTRVLAQNTPLPPAFDRVVVKLRFWDTTGNCPYFLAHERNGSKNNAHDTGNVSYYPVGLSGYSKEIAKHKLIDDQTSKTTSFNPRVPPGPFFTSLFNGTDTKRHFRGGYGSCSPMELPQGDEDDEDGESG